MTEKRRNQQFKFTLSIQSEEDPTLYKPIIEREFDAKKYSLKTRKTVDVRPLVDDIIDLSQQVTKIIEMIEYDLKMKDVDNIYNSKELYLESLKQKFNKN